MRKLWFSPNTREAHKLLNWYVNQGHFLYASNWFQANNFKKNIVLILYRLFVKLKSDCAWVLYLRVYIYIKPK